MANAPLSPTCLCGVAHWHVMFGRVFWCKKCGGLRFGAERNWRVPLDRVGELSTAVVEADGNSDPPTDPGTPDAKKDDGIY
jgi:hypothetical protein